MIMGYHGDIIIYWYKKMIIICDIHEDIMGILMEYNMIYVYIYGSGTLNQLHRRFAQLSTSISCGDFPATFFQEVGG